MIPITVEQPRGQAELIRVTAFVDRVPVIGESFEVQRSDGTVIVSGRVEDVHTGARLSGYGKCGTTWSVVTLTGWTMRDGTNNERQHRAGVE